MAQVFGDSGVGWGVTYLVAAALVYDVMSAFNSSPQTTELNASARSRTLMKWVHLGLLQAVVFIGIAAYVDRQHAKPILFGGLTAAAVLEVAYLHARASGLKNSAPATEQYGA